MNKKGQMDVVGGFFFAVVVILLIIFGFLALIGFRIIEYNEFALVKTFTGHLEPDVLDKGITWVGLLASTIRVSNQVRNYEIIVEGASKDYQDVTMTINLNIIIKQDKVYDFIKNYPSEERYNNYLNNKVQEKIKALMINYDAETILKNRMNISQELTREIKSIDELQYFDFNDLAIQNIKFSEDFSKTLERKAQVGIEQEILSRQKQNMELMNENLKIIPVEDYFRYMLIEKWDGKSNLIISDAVLR